MWFVIDRVGFDNFEMRCRGFDIHSNYDNFKNFVILRELDSKWLSYMVTTRESFKDLDLSLKSLSLPVRKET